MHPDIVQANADANDERELKVLNANHAMACRRVSAARTELTLASTEERRARARYDRKALWIKADKLRAELAQVENEAANIKLED